MANIAAFMNFFCRAFTMDPTNVDELCDEARLTGIKGVYRTAQAHVLNQKAVARKHCLLHGLEYEQCDLIVAHIDGGITVHAHHKGKMIDGNVGSGGDGAFTPTRIGSIPVLKLLDYIDEHGTKEVRDMCSRSGGFVCFFGTSDFKKIYDPAQKGDPKADLIYRSMIYQVCKQIGSMAAVLKGNVDGILLTGGLLRFRDIEDTIVKRCGFIAPVTSYPGEMEQEALAHAVLKVLRGQARAMTYSGRPVWTCFEGLDL